MGPAEVFQINQFVSSVLCVQFPQVSPEQPTGASCVLTCEELGSAMALKKSVAVLRPISAVVTKNIIAAMGTATSIAVKSPN